MDLTPELKQRIDDMTYQRLLALWRNAPVGSPWFQGDSGKYIQERMAHLRSQPGGDERHVQASKSVGWEP